MDPTANIVQRLPSSWPGTRVLALCCLFISRVDLLWTLDRGSKSGPQVDQRRHISMDRATCSTVGTSTRTERCGRARGAMERERRESSGESRNSAKWVGGEGPTCPELDRFAFAPFAPQPLLTPVSLPLNIHPFLSFLPLFSRRKDAFTNSPFEASASAVRMETTVLPDPGGITTWKPVRQQEGLGRQETVYQFSNNSRRSLLESVTSDLGEKHTDRPTYIQTERQTDRWIGWTDTQRHASSQVRARALHCSTRTVARACPSCVRARTTACVASLWICRWNNGEELEGHEASA